MGTVSQPRWDVHYLPIEETDTHNLFIAGVNFQLREHIGIEVVYKNGEAPPLFQDIETIGVSLGIRF